MSKPRQVLPGKTRLLTRRALGRQHLLKPSREFNQLVKYLLAVGSAKYEMRLIAVYVASNHCHVLTDDDDGRSPAFAQWFDSLLARATNCLRCRSDRFWDGQQLSAPEVADAAAVLDRACYVLGNPVKDGLVEHGREWPGFRSTPQTCTRPPEVVERPSWFFDDSERGRMPERAELAFHVPRVFEHLGPQGWAALFGDHLARFEADARARVRAEGRSFLGPRGVRRQPWTSRPRTRERGGRGYVLRPIVIARDTRVRLAVIARHRVFERDHELARQALLAGDLSAVFPAGTYQHRLRLGVRCRPPP